MSRPRVTFIIPAFNAERTIERSIQSITRQTFSAWTAIVVDDGSTDTTPEIARHWAARDPRLTVLSQANAGVSAARNAGIAAADGEFLVFLDADDTISPGYATRMLATLDRNARADAACCGSTRLSTLGQPMERSAAPRLDLRPVELCRKYAPAPLNALMVRRSRVLEAGCFDAALGSYEDWDLWVRLVQSGVVFGVERRALASYWCSGSSLTSNGAAMMRGFRVVAARVQALAADVVPQPQASAMAEFEALLWNCGVAIGRCADPEPTLKEWMAPVTLPAEKHEVAQALLRGLAIGRECSVETLIHHWTAVAPRVIGLLDKVEGRIGTPGAAYALLKALEREVIRGRFSGTIVLTRTIGVTIGWRVLRTGLRVDPTIDSAMFRLPGRRAVLELPIWGAISAPALRRSLVLEGWRRVLQDADLGRLSQLAVVRLAERGLRRFVRLARRHLGARRRGGPPEPLRQPALEPMMSGQSALDQLIASERARVAANPIGVTARPHPGRTPEPYGIDGDALVKAWDDFYAVGDPWNYGSDYEQVKYNRTMAIIPPGPIGRAMELGCSEGRFTQRLAARAAHVRAVDISSTALARAAERCQEFDNIEYLATDIFTVPIEGRWDLITASEMLYHIEDVAALPAFLGRLRDALNPGGYLVQAHAFDVAVTPGRTGFDWMGPLDARSIADALCGTAGLSHVRGLVTDLYRIDLFRKGDASGAPIIEIVPVGSELDPSLESGVVWNGAIARRAEVAQDRAHSLPVLMYHRIADDGPAGLEPYRITPRDFAHQLRFLRRRGFRSASVDEWQARHIGGSLIGRPILITFDDAYQDFYDAAWPILRRSGFTAHVFVPTDRVGGHATWDEAYGPPAPIMNWSAIAELAADGVTFGSHLASHTRADCLTSTALLQEAVRSRAQLESVLATPVTTIALPFGITSQRAEIVLASAGYRQGFADHGGRASVFGLSLSTPRIEIAATDTIATFAQKVGMSAFPPDQGDLVS